MEVFELSIKYLSIIGLISSKGFFKTIQVYIWLAIYIGGFIAGSITYMYYHSNDFEGRLNAILAFASGLATLGAFVSMGLHLKKVLSLINEYQLLVDQSDNLLTAKISKLFFSFKIFR